MDKLIIEVRINEYASRKHNANVPYSPHEICEEAMLERGRVNYPLSRARPTDRRALVGDGILRRDRAAD